MRPVAVIPYAILGAGFGLVPTWGQGSLWGAGDWIVYTGVVSIALTVLLSRRPEPAAVLALDGQLPSSVPHPLRPLNVTHLGEPQFRRLRAGIFNSHRSGQPPASPDVRLERAVSRRQAPQSRTSQADSPTGKPDGNPGRPHTRPTGQWLEEEVASR